MQSSENNLRYNINLEKKDCTVYKSSLIVDFMLFSFELGIELFCNFIKNDFNESMKVAIFPFLISIVLYIVINGIDDADG